MGAELMIEWLFKYPVSSWREASLGFDSSLPEPGLWVAVLVGLVLVAISLSRRSVSKGRRSLLFLLQGLIATIVLVMLWQPALRLDVAEQGENTVAWMVDTSGSMLTEDVLSSGNASGDSQNRLAAATSIVDAIASDDAAEFEAALYSQGETLVPVSSTEQLALLDTSATTNLADGLDELLGTVAQNALAAVVLISDGSDNSDTIDAQWWQRLSAAGVPVNTVGVGQLIPPSDIQLSDVNMAEQAAPNVQLTARLDINHSQGGSARVRVHSADDLIVAEDIELPSDTTTSVHEVSVPSGDAGIRQLRFEVLSNDGLADPDTINNSQPRVLQVSDSPKRILYVEGEPRWEFKFMRRALENHPSVELVSLLRTSPNKFYRQGVRDAGELAEGFPARREDLFSYDAVIIGSLEAAELNTKQQLALRDFVSVRGGSLLMLAGRHGLADGGWGRSVVAAALPVILDARLSAQTFERRRKKVMPTVSGYRTAWLALNDTPAANADAWEGLPEIADWQALGNVKPGAVTLLEHVEIENDSVQAQPLFVSQRYGKGQSLVLGTSGTWRWQMSLESSDQRHESFWRQVATMLVDGVVPRISAASGKGVYRDSKSATLSVNAYSATYEPLREASLPAQLTLPDGSTKTVELQADSQQIGRYQTRVDTTMDGPYTLNAMTPLGGESPQNTLVSAEHWWVRESGTAESFDNSLQQDFLQRVADASGGRYLPFSDADNLADVLSQNNAALKRNVSLPLWNMPFLFLCLFIAKATEWLLRLKWKRL